MDLLLVSRKYDMLLLVPLNRYTFFTLSIFKNIIIIMSIFFIKMFNGFLLSHNAVNEFCYVAQSVNNVTT
jgi:hypothetical protein